jgi:hypothetical protein
MEAGHASEMREGGKKQTSSITTDPRVTKVQAGDARVERQRARQQSATSLFEVHLELHLDLCERRVAGLDALQQLQWQVQVR